MLANLQVVNDTNLPVHDTVSVSLELYLQLFPPESAERFILVKFVGSPSFFSRWKLVKISTINDSLKGSTIQFVNTTSLDQFQGQFTLTKAMVRGVPEKEVPVLEKVFISVPSAVYEVLSAMDSEAVKRRVEQYTGGVVGEGDTVRELNGSVVLCEPVCQGKVGDIYIIKQNGSEKVVLKEFKEPEMALELSSYLSSALDIALEDEKRPEMPVWPLKNPSLARNLPDVFSKEDNEWFVFINTRELMKLRLAVFHGDTVVLVAGEARVLVKIFTIPEPNTFGNGLHLSPILMANLGLFAGEKVHLESVKPTRYRQLHISSTVPLAKSVTIARVASPITLDKTYQQHFFAGLKTAFNAKFKVVRSGDLVPVTIDSVLAKTMFDMESEDSVIPSGDADAVAWFQIVDISGDGESVGGVEEDSSCFGGQFGIDPSKTRMILSGVEHRQLPANSRYGWHEYLELPPLFRYDQAPGFTYAQQLKKILITTANSKLNLKTYVLVNSMSRGLGKTTVVRNVALELGINVVELDAVEYVNPGSEQKTLGLIGGAIDKILGPVGSQEEGETYRETHHETGEDEGNHRETYREAHRDVKVPTIIFLRHMETLCPEVNDNEQGASVAVSLSLKLMQMLDSYVQQHRVVVVMTCNDIDKLNSTVRSAVKFQVDVGVPSETERRAMLRHVLSHQTGEHPVAVRRDVSVDALALQSAGLTPRDLKAIVKRARSLAMQRLARVPGGAARAIAVGNGGSVVLIPEDFSTAINEARNSFSDSIGAPRIPNVGWDDIGGLDVVKDEILDTIDMPLKHPELFSNGLKKRSGILFYGPPGTGKTLLAKAIATNFSLNFFSVKGPELLNMYIGESEANVRRVFQKARDAKPCVIFFDELDSVAPKRGNQGDSGGVMDRIVSQLLAELDGMSGGGEGGGDSGNGGGSGDGVFVVGATNRPDLLDEALLRPGRFDKMLYLGISDTDEKQVKILEALTRKFKLDDDVDLYAVAKRCSFTFTGADFYALCSDSMLNAMTRIASEVDGKIKQYIAENGEVSTRWWFDNVAGEEDTEVVVKMEDFVKAQGELVPSVSAEELEHYLRIRRNFEGSSSGSGGNGGGNGGGATSGAEIANGTVYYDENTINTAINHSENTTNHSDTRKNTTTNHINTSNGSANGH